MNEALNIVRALRAEFSRMRLREWEDRLPEFVEKFRARDDLPQIHEEADENTTVDARIRVICRRAFRAKHGVSIESSETVQHHLFGRF